MLGFMSKPLGATPLRRAGPAAAGAVPGRWPLRGRESPQDRPPGRGAQCAFTASHECDHHRVTSLRTLIMGSLIILIGYTHISTTTAALGHLSQASAAHDQTDRPPREAATDGICDQPRRWTSPAGALSGCRAALPPWAGPNASQQRPGSVACTRSRCSKTTASPQLQTVERPRRPSRVDTSGRGGGCLLYTSPSPRDA